MNRKEIEEMLGEQQAHALLVRDTLTELCWIICDEEHIPEGVSRTAPELLKDHELDAIDPDSADDNNLNAQWLLAYTALRRAGHKIPNPSWLMKMTAAE